MVVSLFIMSNHGYRHTLIQMWFCSSNNSMWHSWTDQTDGRFTSHVVHSSDCQPPAIDVPFLPDWSVTQTIPYDTLGHWTDGRFTSRIVHSLYCQPRAKNVPLSKLVCTSNNSIRKWNPAKSEMNDFPTDLIEISVSRWFVVSFSGLSLTSSGKWPIKFVF